MAGRQTGRQTGRQAGRQVEGEIFVVIFSLKVCVLYCQPGLSRFFACVFVGIQPVVSDRPTRRVSYAASVLRASPKLPRFLAPQLIRAREHGVVGCGMDSRGTQGREVMDSCDQERPKLPFGGPTTRETAAR